MLKVVGGVAALVVAVVTHAAAFFGFVFFTCSVSDNAQRVPARASAQGWVCGRAGDDVWLPVVLAVLTASVVLAVVLAVRSAAASGARQVLAATACLWLPAVLLAAASAPPDSCTDEQRRELRAYACDRTGNS